MGLSIKGVAPGRGADVVAGDESARGEFREEAFPGELIQHRVTGCAIQPPQPSRLFDREAHARHLEVLAADPCQKLWITRHA